MFNLAIENKYVGYFSILTRPQHLCGFKLIGEMCKAEMSGDVVDSCTVELSPSSTILGGIYTKEVGTAG